ncbi:MAG: DUF2130 domain-containing protein [Thermodesulfobacteriota bacterium]
MDGQTIRCPNCGANIPLTEALYAQIKARLGKEFEERERARELAIKKKEDELAASRADLEESKKAIKADIEKRLAGEKKRLAEEAKKKAREAMEVELKDARAEATEKAKERDEARRAELDLRKKARALEEEKQKMALESARQLDAEREKIRLSAIEVFSEEHRLKDAEKEKVITDLKKALDEARRKAEQGSQQAQGEVGELDLEDLLASRFPMDEIEPVPKGVRGADILQRVNTRGGRHCGSIVWEVKRTKAFSDGWITKLKDDQREVSAEVAVLVTETMPKGVANFSLVDGVWVTSVQLAGHLAEALRVGLIQVAQSRSAAVGKGEKMEAIYGYLSGPEFKQKIEAIVESFGAMKGDLDREKNAMTRIWAKREKQIERVMTNTIRMYGDMQGIIGASLPEIKSLELESGGEAVGGEADEGGEGGGGGEGGETG